jgi:hypothetical protein
MALPAIFKALMATFQTRQTALSGGAMAGRGLFLSLSRKRKLLKAAKNSPGVLQSYVTYDTLHRTPILKTTSL